MKLLRNPAFLAAVSISMILMLYFALVADRALLLVASDSPAAKGMGAALFVFPTIGVWWLAHEWRLGSTVQRMSTILDQEGRLPVHDGETLPNGRLTPAAAEAVFEMAHRAVDAAPDDWRSWFHVAYACEALRDRPMARKALRSAADLFRAEQRATRAKRGVDQMGADADA